MKNKPIFYLFLCLSLAFNAYAAKSEVINPLDAPEKPEEEAKNPLGCRDLGYQYYLKTVSLLTDSVGEQNSLYFIYNRMDKPLLLYQMRPKDSTRSIFMNHEINPHQWAALSTSEKRMDYICAMDDGKTPYGKIVDCEESVKVCEYANVRFGLNTRGSYWLVKSNTKNGAVRGVVNYGIIPQ